MARGQKQCTVRDEFRYRDASNNSKEDKKISKRPAADADKTEDCEGADVTDQVRV